MSTTQPPDSRALRRLAQECREDDERMTSAPWARFGPWPYVTVYRDIGGDDTSEPPHVCDVFRPADTTKPPPAEYVAEADAIARTRNRLPDLARALEAAAELAEREATLDADRAHVAAERDAGTQRILALEDECKCMEAERDAARAEVNQLRQQVADLLRRPLDITVKELQARIRELEACIRGVLDVEPGVSDADTDRIERAWSNGGRGDADFGIPPLLGTARHLHGVRTVLRAVLGRPGPGQVSDAPAVALERLPDLNVTGGATGIRTSEITVPVRVDRITVSGPGSVGIDLDD